MESLPNLLGLAAEDSYCFWDFGPNDHGETWDCLGNWKSVFTSAHSLIHLTSDFDDWGTDRLISLTALPRSPRATAPWYSLDHWLSSLWKVQTGVPLSFPGFMAQDKQVSDVTAEAQSFSIDKCNFDKLIEHLLQTFTGVLKFLWILLVPAFRDRLMSLEVSLLPTSFQVITLRLNINSILIGTWLRLLTC